MRIPTPPTMQNHGNYIASICEIVRWLGEQAEALGVNVFTGFPVDSLLVEGDRVRRRAHRRRRAWTATASRGPATSRPPTSPRRSPCSPRARAAR